MPRRSKNISREIRDIRFPTSHVPEKTAASEIPVRKVVRMPLPPAPHFHPHRRFPLRPLVVFVVIALVATVVGGVFWFRDRAAEALRFQAVLQRADQLAGTNASSTSAQSLPNSLSGWLTLFRSTAASFGTFKDGSFQAIDALNRVGGLIEDIPSRLLAKDGSGLVADLTQLRDNLKTLQGFLEKIGDTDSNANLPPGLSDYAAYAPDVARAEQAAEALLVLLQSPGTHHFLILFGNSAELRPGGGFLGSFADVPFGSSTLGEITVHDVNEADRGLAATIVPPKPLQSIVTRWRAADANWFFDYPTSAGKTLDLLSRSSLYASSTLEGAILISPEVIHQLLEITGPITLADGKTVVDGDTIIPLIQKEVQEGQANGAEHPKEILSELLPPLESKLQGLDSDGFQILGSAAQKWVRNRDLAIFMKDPALAKLFAYYHADAASYVLPQDFSGDYFAAVNANVGGGKSDALIADTVDFQSDLRSDGLVQDSVAVVRESAASDSDEWWYRVTNQDYLQAFTPSGTVLTAASGGQSRTIAARADYSRGFEVDAEVRTMEASLKPVPGFPTVSQFREGGKNVFATWLEIPAGDSANAHFTYQRMLKKPFQDGDHYTLVFERQPGAQQSLHAIVNAPPGFVWQENGVSSYEYFTEEVPGRTVLDLTLKKI